MTLTSADGLITNILVVSIKENKEWFSDIPSTVSKIIEIYSLELKICFCFESLNDGPYSHKSRSQLPLFHLTFWNPAT